MAEIDTGKIVGEVKTKIRLRGARKSAFKIWLGAVIIKLGILITGMDGQLEIEDDA